MAKSPAQLDAEIAEFLAKPHKLGDPAWERKWAGLLREKHSKARAPTIHEIARALRYIEGEYQIADDGRIDGEQIAEGLAFGQARDIDAETKQRARELGDEFTTAQWLTLAERANHLAKEQLETPRYLKAE